MHFLNKNIKTILLDLDGTVYLSNNLIYGSRETIYQLREKYKVIFLTNNTSTSKKDYVKKLSNLGIESRESDFFTASDATIYYLNKHFKNKKIHLFGTNSLKDEFIKNKINLNNTDPDLCVVGFHTKFTYDELALLTSFIRNGIPFIATHPDINCPTSNGFIPDVGSFLALIEKSTNQIPIAICGKPEKYMAEGILNYTNNQNNEIAMVGDRVSTDIKFGNLNGFQTFLVLTGEGTEEELKVSRLNAKVINSINNLLS